MMEKELIKQETAGITPDSQQEQPEDLARLLILGGVEASATSFAVSETLREAWLAQDLQIAALQQGSASAADWLKDAGVELVALAGLQGEVPALPEGITAIGAGETESMANRPYVHCVNGIRFGVVSFAEQPAGDFAKRADILSLMAYDRVRMLLNQCDHVVVLVQSGLTEAELPLPEWRARYRRFIDAGASLVVDTGRARGWEAYKQGLVFYGLGAPTGADALGLFVTLRRNGKMNYEARALQNAAGVLDYSKNDSFRAQIDAQNTMLADEEAYRSAADEMCTRLYCASESAQKRGVLGIFSPHMDESERLFSLLGHESERLVALRALRLRTDGEKAAREIAKKA
jgi:hypothetical protein